MFTFGDSGPCGTCSARVPAFPVCCPKDPPACGLRPPDPALHPLTTTAITIDGTRGVGGGGNRTQLSRPTVAGRVERTPQRARSRGIGNAWRADAEMWRLTMAETPCEKCAEQPTAT
eukprot:1252043-Prymnesium_polylepis.1